MGLFARLPAGPDIGQRGDRVDGKAMRFHVTCPEGRAYSASAGTPVNGGEGPGAE
jgi:hypothetical protein